jgi:GTP-binding protein
VAKVAIVGRPNVGKSTLFNRLTRSRRAIVGDEPGITRDRIYGRAEWNGVVFEVADTGGVVPDSPDEIPAAIFRQARTAIAEAAAILMVVDGRSAIAAPDRTLARLLLKTGKPVFLAVNKIESDRQLADLGPFYELGISHVVPVSAEHGLGLDDLLDALLPALAEDRSQATGAGDGTGETAGETERETRIAIIGRPNVGKSTLLNRLTGEDRALVSDVPGTTRDAVDALVLRNSRRYRFVDTAGIRRKGKTRMMAEKLSVVMARRHLEEADVALIVLDAAEGVVALDATIAGYAHEANRSCILVVNKWDLARAKKLRQNSFATEIRDSLKFLAYAPIVFISAETGEGLSRLYDTLDQVAAERNKRISTADMNRFLAAVDFDRAPLPAGRRVKIYYMSQVRSAPPTFVLFVDKRRPLHFSFQRYFENQLRRAFGFIGTPLVLKTRASR